jgi:hypothetical protein
LATLFTGLHYLSVTVAMAIYHPMAAWHRFFSIIVMLFAMPCGTQFILLFLAPVSLEKSRLRKILLYGETAAALLTIIFVFAASIPPEAVFVNDAKIWTADIRTPAIVTAVILMVFY